MGNEMNINVKIDDLKTVTCECEGKHFIQVIMYKILPALYSPSGQEQVMAVPNNVKCVACGKVQGIDSLAKCFKERDKEGQSFKPVLVKG